MDDEDLEGQEKTQGCIWMMRKNPIYEQKVRREIYMAAIRELRRELAVEIEETRELIAFLERKAAELSNFKLPNL